MTTRHLTKDLKVEIDENSKHIGDLKTSDAVQNIKIDGNCEGVKMLTTAANAVKTAILKIEISNAQTNKIASWAIGIITSLLVLVLAGLITGQATLNFK